MLPYMLIPPLVATPAKRHLQTTYTTQLASLLTLTPAPPLAAAASEPQLDPLNRHRQRLPHRHTHRLPGRVLTTHPP